MNLVAGEKGGVLHKSASEQHGCDPQETTKPAFKFFDVFEYHEIAVKLTWFNTSNY